MSKIDMKQKGIELKDKLNATTVIVKEKVQANSSKIMTVAGTAVMVGSVAMIVDYAVKKNKDKANPAELVAGIAGVLIGASLAAEPTVKKIYKRKKVVAVDPETEEVVTAEEEEAVEATVLTEEEA